MGRHAYADFDEFADAIDGLAGRFVPTARSNGEWWIDKMGLRGSQLQYLQVGGATTFAGDGTPGMVTLGIPMTDPSTLRSDGQPLADNTFNLIIENQPFTCSSRSLSRWAAVAVRQEKLTKREPFLDTPTPGGARTQTEKPLLDGVRSLILRIWSDDQAVSIVDPVAQAAVEDEMMHAVTNVLQASNRANDRHIGRPQVSRTRVIAHCLELIDASEGQPLFIDDLCNATQVSERTLRNIFQEYFGVGPMRLLKVRQLREIRSALLRGDPIADTVTKIAARFGVWDFSLFARNYRALYGEAPSQTLRKPRDRANALREDEGMTPTWIAFAARQFALQQPMQGAGETPMRMAES